jgi:hypothetical protein
VFGKVFGEQRGRGYTICTNGAGWHQTATPVNPPAGQSACQPATVETPFGNPAHLDVPPLREPVDDPPRPVRHQPPAHGVDHAHLVGGEEGDRRALGVLWAERQVHGWLVKSAAWLLLLLLLLLLLPLPNHPAHCCLDVATCR